MANVKDEEDAQQQLGDLAIIQPFATDKIDLDGELESHKMDNEAGIDEDIKIEGTVRASC